MIQISQNPKNNGTKLQQGSLWTQKIQDIIRLMKSEEKQQGIDLDSYGDPLMTPKTIKTYCFIDGLPQAPEFNDKLYLYEKGFRNILPLNMYQNLISLWLNKNKIAKIENLEGLKNLVCLYLQDNHISKIQGLDFLSELEILNLERNKITKVENLGKLAKLKNLSLAQNYLSNYQTISQLSEVKNLTNLDVSENQIENSEQIFNLMKVFNKMACLSLRATPFARGFKNYRKNFIASLPSLKFLDDRPVQQSEHRLCEAWALGGEQEEKKIRNKIQNEEKLSEKQFANQNQRKFKIQPSQQKKSQKNFIRPIAAEAKNQEKGPKKQVQIPEAQTIQKNLEQNSQIVTEQLIPQSSDVWKDNAANTWNSQYEKILQALLEKYEFDFSEVQPRFNMIVGQINKKLKRATNRFEIEQLQKIWTGLEVLRRKEAPLI